MFDPNCLICRRLASIEHTLMPINDFLRRVYSASVVRCACPDVKHTPLVAHDHRRAGCIGYVPPAIEIIASLDEWEDTA